MVFVRSFECFHFLFHFLSVYVCIHIYSIRIRNFVARILHSDVIADVSTMPNFERNLYELFIFPCLRQVICMCVCVCCDETTVMNLRIVENHYLSNCRFLDNAETNNRKRRKAR